MEHFVYCVCSFPPFLAHSNIYNVIHQCKRRTVHINFLNGVTEVTKSKFSVKLTICVRFARSSHWESFFVCKGGKCCCAARVKVRGFRVQVCAEERPFHVCCGHVCSS